MAERLLPAGPLSPVISSTLFVGVILTRPEGQQIALPDGCKMILLVNLLGLLTRGKRHDLGMYFSQIDLHD